MSITKGFEERRIRADEFTGATRVYGANDVQILLTHTRELEVMLKKVQWGFSGTECPCCGRLVVNERHEVDHKHQCQLSKLMEGI